VDRQRVQEEVARSSRQRFADVAVEQETVRTGDPDLGLWCVRTAGLVDAALDFGEQVRGLRRVVENQRPAGREARRFEEQGRVVLGPAARLRVVEREPCCIGQKPRQEGALASLARLIGLHKGPGHD